MVPFSTLRSLVYAALASGLLLTAGCHRADVVADDVTSAEDMGQGNEENATTADLVEAAAPHDATDPASATVADATELPALLSGCATRTYDAATRILTTDFGLTPTACAVTGATAGAESWSCPAAPTARPAPSRPLTCSTIL